MFCTKCGCEVKSEFSFCVNCGNAVESVSYDSCANHINNNRVAKKHNGMAVASMVLGIVSLCAWIIPLLGFPISIVGLVLGVFGQKSDNRAFGITGLVTSVIGLVVCTANSAIGAYLGATGMLF